MIDFVLKDILSYKTDVINVNTQLLRPWTLSPDRCPDWAGRWKSPSVTYTPRAYKVISFINKNNAPWNAHMYKLKDAHSGWRIQQLLQWCALLINRFTSLKINRISSIKLLIINIYDVCTQIREIVNMTLTQRREKWTSFRGPSFSLLDQQNLNGKRQIFTLGYFWIFPSNACKHDR